MADRFAVIGYAGMIAELQGAPLFPNFAGSGQAARRYHSPGAKVGIERAVSLLHVMGAIFGRKLSATIGA